jgi:hypothetical protein
LSFGLTPAETVNKTECFYKKILENSLKLLTVSFIDMYFSSLRFKLAFESWYSEKPPFSISPCSNAHEQYEAGLLLAWKLWS